MFVDDSTYKRGGKTYRRVLLRTSYRVDGAVHHKTISNLSDCSDKEIAAIKLALKHKSDLKILGNIKDDIQTVQGLSVGAVLTLQQLSKRIGLVTALGNSREAKLILWLVLATVIAQGSRLSAVRLAQQHAACDILGLDAFNEDDLYYAMDWLDKNQSRIELSLFNTYYKEVPFFYLYDVTSSYFEGTENELADYGYNRDGKKGKKQIVIGLMTDVEGWPIAVEVFTGNTNDMLTVPAQIKKVAERFGVKKVAFVGDKGMIKSTQIEALEEHGFNYITSITKPQIVAMIDKGQVQLNLFDEELTEICIDDVRYILRKNPVRTEEIKKSRSSKLASLNKFIEKQNLYLREHPKAKLDKAVEKVKAKNEALRISSWVEVEKQEGSIALKIDENNLAKEALLDGCYVLKTDIAKEDITSEQVHKRYKGLAKVETAFRTMKTILLEMRAIYVRKANRTRAHVFTIMLAYMLVHKLKEYWRDVELTTEEAIAELTSICALKVKIKNQEMQQTIPKPRQQGLELLRKAEIILPDALPCKNVTVVTRKKLVSERK
ncbi:transposase [Gammaproteobacteria bacterium]